MKHILDDDRILTTIMADGSERTLTEDERYSLFEVEVEHFKNELRIKRNQLLSETDHWAYQDTPDMSQEQIEYRQALRDITNTYSSLIDVVWPVKPE